MKNHGNRHRNAAAIRGPMAGFLLLIFFIAVAGTTVERRPPPGELSRIHRQSLATSDDCASCHGKDNQIFAAKCLKCHGEMARRIRENRGFHADKDDGCELCHAEHRGKQHKLIDWDIAEFDHGDTGYPLIGGHLGVEQCSDCHNKRTTPPGIRRTSFLLHDSGCSTCHTSPHTPGYENCSDCHQPHGWWIDSWRSE